MKNTFLHNSARNATTPIATNIEAKRLASFCNSSGLSTLEKVFNIDENIIAKSGNTAPLMVDAIIPIIINNNSGLFNLNNLENGVFVCLYFSFAYGCNDPQRWFGSHSFALDTIL